MIEGQRRLYMLDKGVTYSKECRIIQSQKFEDADSDTKSSERLARASNQLLICGRNISKNTTLVFIETILGLTEYHSTINLVKMPPKRNDEKDLL